MLWRVFSIILHRSWVMSHALFLNNFKLWLMYESYICKLHILRLQILWELQWWKNFGDPPTQIFQDDPRFNPPVYEFSCSLRFHAYAISFWLETSPKFIQNLGSSYIIRRGILCWFRIFSQNFDSAHAFRENYTLKNLRGRI